ncbi:phosphosulfolactate synthase [Xylanibacillus composti]|nr:phosphosulfolactate synthase [Xylanibacillus composti]MDT9726276.1 phosphosulfolactate synthase [Xylanibacillus composti]
MESLSQVVWDSRLSDPSGSRLSKPRTRGLTMVIDKGLGLSAFADLMETAGSFIDVVKLGFGTSALYPIEMIAKKIELAHQHQITIMPGGTFLEVAVAQKRVDPFFSVVAALGFSGLEVSDGTIELNREQRSTLIKQALKEGLTVFTEYGKKAWGSVIDQEGLLRTVYSDLECGAELVTVEGRESGRGAGLYDESGSCRDPELLQVVERLPDPYKLMWETPLKSQQVWMMQTLGRHVNLGNIAPEDILSVEALRRGLRSDTFVES